MERCLSYSIRANCIRVNSWLLSLILSTAIYNFSTTCLIYSRTKYTSKRIFFLGFRFFFFTVTTAIVICIGWFYSSCIWSIVVRYWDVGTSFDNWGRREDVRLKKKNRIMVCAESKLTLKNEKLKIWLIMILQKNLRVSFAEVTKKAR